jgi:RepB DNA-primase from phage plasmid/CHC2 zinc finger
MSPNLLSSEAQLRAYLATLTGGAPEGRFLDVRWRARGAPMRRRFIAADRIDAAVSLALTLAPRNDMYVGVALRDGNINGGRASISRCRVAWVESDDPATAEQLLAFVHQPTMIVSSGTAGHLQLYWLLGADCEPDQLHRVNRRLAIALGGDSACADPARILRLPGTFNHKHDPPGPVRLLAHRGGLVHTLTALAADLPEDAVVAASGEPVPARRAHRSRLEAELLAIPPAEYARVLVGRSPDREGKIRCPFHDDATPSLQLYPDGGFFCFGSACRRGGTIFDFAGHLWGLTPRGVGFLEIRTRLAYSFGVRPDPSGFLPPTGSGQLDERSQASPAGTRV